MSRGRMIIKARHHCMSVAPSSTLCHLTTGRQMGATKTSKSRPAPSGPVWHCPEAFGMHSGNVHFFILPNMLCQSNCFSCFTLNVNLSPFHHWQLLQSMWADKRERQNYHFPFKPIYVTSTLCSKALQLSLPHPLNIPLPFTWFSAFSSNL